MSKSSSSLAVRAGAVLLAAATISVAGAAVAEAHVRVTPDNTTAGGYSKLTFKVPNESDTAGTTSIVVSLPTDKPFTSVMTEPVAGWKATVTESKLAQPVDLDGTTVTKAPSTVTFTAEKGNQINPGEFQEFAISVGPLPESGTVQLPVEQTYSDGKVSNWNEPMVDGQAEPENPAPSFTITPAEGESGHGAMAAGTSDTPSAGASTSSTDSAARWLGGGGLAVGVIGLALAAVAWRRVATLQNAPGRSITSGDKPAQGSLV